MALHEFDGDRHRPRLCRAQADDGFPALMQGVDARQIVEAFGESLVDRIVLRARALHHFSERSKGGPGQRFGLENDHASLPKMRSRDTPPSGKMLSFTWLTGPSRWIALPSKT